MFAKRLKELRKNSKMTQRDLSKILNIRDTAISKYELGQREPNISMLKNISIFFGVSIDYLVGRTDIKDCAIENQKCASKNDLDWSESEYNQIEKFKKFIIFQRKER
ncbi:MAG: helix-turn-helix domain-containing protein [Peptostreptococcaceae bacterium]|jgi:transcriptional regulator with XRE-family HTH domain|nr:helix-turn-helix domain-containing protein [Peptostreptococcaceae bacterium]